ncbi:MAG: DUF934 domain-containing protein [Alkalilacustris sp.]
MTVLITDMGFGPDDWTGGFVPAAALHRTPCAVGLGVDADGQTDPRGLARHLAAIALIRIRLRHFADAGGFALAQRLRAMGYGGRLRAQGHVLAHQYTMARRAGFDEVEISAEMALRQPAEHWRFRGNWRHDRYGSRLPPRLRP